MEDLERARELFFEGIAYYEKEQFDLAEGKFYESLTLVPDRISTMTNLSATLIKQKKFEAAKELCLRTLSIDSASADAWNYLGLIDYEQSNQNEAIAKFDQALSINQNDAAALNNKGVSLNELGQFDAALACFEKAIAFQPDYAEAYCNRGNTLKALERWSEALDSYDRAIELKPDYTEAYNNRGNVLKDPKRLQESLDSHEQAIEQAQEAYMRRDWSGAEQLCRGLVSARADNSDALNLLGMIAAQTQRPQEAAELFGRAVAVNPNDASACSNLGNVLRELKRPDEALASYDRAIKLKPDYAEAYYNRGGALHELKRLDEALDSYDRAIKLKPDYAEAYNNRGGALQKLKRLDEALDSYDRAIKLQPDFAEVYYNRGVALQELKRLDDALDSYARATEIKPDYAEAYYNRGNALTELKRPEAAQDSYARATKIQPDYAEAYYNRGVALQELKRLDEALDSYDRASKIKPDYVEAYNNRGVALQELKRLDEALDSYDRALEIKPDYAEAYYNRGGTLRELKRLHEALESYDRALMIKPDYAEAYYNRGGTLHELKRFDEALESYDRALMIKPDYPFLYGAWLHTKMILCDWSDAENQIAECIKRIERDDKTTPPLPFLALVDSLILQRKAAEIWVTNKYPASRALPSITKRAGHAKIRIGYFSADYHDHATAYLMAELFERHDRNRFELVAFSFGPDHKDGMRKRVAGAFDQFVDVRTKSDKEVALLSRNIEIDVAVDLKGFTQDDRPGIFSYRAAPIQVNYIGYPGTMGAEYIDYLIADRTLIPDTCQRHYAEKIVYLPNSYQVNDRKRQIAAKQFSREELGLPQTGFVFCCFNNNYKITASTFDGWMRILKQVRGSVLWLLEDNLTAATNLRKEAEARGLSAERLIFAKRMPLPEHLARHRAADLFLDTLPCNAHTTASDALWAGLLVLTRVGEAFAGRVAASLLNAIDIPELITTTQEQYEALAVELATDPTRLGTMREKLARNRLAKPLFDTELFTRHIEDAYTQMYERYHADLPPEHIHVAS